MTVNDINQITHDLQQEGKGDYTVVVPRGLIDNEVSRVDVRDDEKKVNIL